MSIPIHPSLSQQQKNFIADKVMDAMNYSVAVSVFNEIITTRRLGLVSIGLLSYLGIMGAVLSLVKGNNGLN